MGADTLISQKIVQNSFFAGQNRISCVLYIAKTQMLGGAYSLTMLKNKIAKKA